MRSVQTFTYGERRTLLFHWVNRMACPTVRYENSESLLEMSRVLFEHSSSSSSSVCGQVGEIWKSGLPKEVTRY